MRYVAVGVVGVMRVMGVVRMMVVGVVRMMAMAIAVAIAVAVAIVAPEVEAILHRRHLQLRRLQEGRRRRRRRRGGRRCLCVVAHATSREMGER